MRIKRVKLSGRGSGLVLLQSGTSANVASMSRVEPPVLYPKTKTLLKPYCALMRTATVFGTLISPTSLNIHRLWGSDGKSAPLPTPVLGLEVV